MKVTVVLFLIAFTISAVVNSICPSKLTSNRPAFTNDAPSVPRQFSGVTLLRIVSVRLLKHTSDTKVTTSVVRLTISLDVFNATVRSGLIPVAAPVFRTPVMSSALVPMKPQVATDLSVSGRLRASSLAKLPMAYSYSSVPTPPRSA